MSSSNTIYLLKSGQTSLLKLVVESTLSCDVDTKMSTKNDDETVAQDVTTDDGMDCESETRIQAVTEMFTPYNFKKPSQRAKRVKCTPRNKKDKDPEIASKFVAGSNSVTQGNSACFIVPWDGNPVMILNRRRKVRIDSEGKP